MQTDHAERYVRLGLQLGRHGDDIVDAYFGPRELEAAVDAAAPVEPAELAASARVLAAELDDGWLRDQVAALASYAGVLAGESRPYEDEVEACYQVRPHRTDEAVFAEVHERLEGLLPGTGTLHERYDAFRRSAFVPAERVEQVAGEAIAAARACTRELVDLPAGEAVDLEIVHDVPWMGYCRYVGGLRSVISIKGDLPQSIIDLIRLVIHETYPGHHVERCLKDELLVRERGLLEETIVLLPTPQSMIAEGIASIAPSVLLDRAPDAFAAVAQAAGIDIDFPRAIAVEAALETCRWVEVNAALMLYADGTGEDEVRAYLEHWAILDAELSAHAVRFLRGATIARLHRHLPGRVRALQRLRRRRRGSLPSPALGAGARRRAQGRGGLGRAGRLDQAHDELEPLLERATSIHSRSVWSSPPTGPRPSSVGMPHAPVQQPSETPPESSAPIRGRGRGVAQGGVEERRRERHRRPRAAVGERERDAVVGARPLELGRRDLEVGGHTRADVERGAGLARAPCWRRRRPRRS